MKDSRWLKMIYQCTPYGRRRGRPQQSWRNNPGGISISLRFILILSSHLRQSLPKGLFPVVVLVKFWKHSYLLPWSSHLNLRVFITLTILDERYKVLSSSLWSLLHCPFSSLLDPNIRLRVLYPKWKKVRVFSKF